jgi:hypothetical protein
VIPQAGITCGAPKLIFAEGLEKSLFLLGLQVLLIVFIETEYDCHHQLVLSWLHFAAFGSVSD